MLTRQKLIAIFYLLASAFAQALLTIVLIQGLSRLALSSNGGGGLAGALIVIAFASYIPYVSVIFGGVMIYLISRSRFKNSFYLSLATTISLFVSYLVFNETVLRLTQHLMRLSLLTIIISLVIYILYTLLHCVLKKNYLVLPLILILLLISYVVSTNTIRVENSRQNDEVILSYDQKIYAPIDKSKIYRTVIRTNDPDKMYAVVLFGEERGLAQDSNYRSILSVPKTLVDPVDLNPPIRCSITDSYGKIRSVYNRSVDDRNGCIINTTKGGRTFYEEKPELGPHRTFYAVFDDTIVYIDNFYQRMSIEQIGDIIDSLKEYTIIELQSNEVIIQ